MNQKLCKRLRRQARQESIGMPARRLVLGKNGRAENYPYSTRGIYRQLKRDNT